MKNETDASFFRYAMEREVLTMRKGEATRQRIIEEAAPIFNQQGFAGCSMQDLMQATGLEKGGIYRHFANKEELAAEAFRYTWEAAWNARWLHVDEMATGMEKLKQLIANFIDHRSPVAGGCPILNTAIDADDGNPVLRTRVAKGTSVLVEPATGHSGASPGTR